VTAPSTHDIATMVRDAVASNTMVRAVGEGSWLHGGPVVNDATATPIRPCAGVIEYTPGDLVITVHAGTSLNALAAICADSGQMLAIAPYGAPHATIGAVVATATAAPLAYDELTIRDLVLGLTVVTGTGDIVRVGGKVVKNVAGFDLVRLHTGAFGTLGIITEVSVRLHARPIMDHVVTGTLDDPPHEWVPRLLANRAPLPMVVRMAPGEAAQLFARCTGNPARASALRGMVQSYGARHAFTLGPSDTLGAHDVTAPTSLLHHVPEQALVLRARTTPTYGAVLIDAARRTFPEATLLFQPSRGSLRLVTPHTNDANHRVAAFIASAPPSVPFSTVVEQGASPQREPHALDVKLKHTFDPAGVFPERRQAFTPGAPQ